MSAWFAGLLLGIAGSGHCALMCGPLTVTISRTLRRPSRAGQLRQQAVYHAGRVATYLVIAAPLGYVSEAAAVRGLGRGLSIGLGVLLASFALRRRGGWLPARLAARWTESSTRLCAAAGRWMHAHPAGGPFVAGAANGLLPCGLVYAAAMAAAALGSMTGAIALMIGFGCGTVPSLLALGVSAQAIPVAVRARLRALTPAALILVGGLLILRGLILEPHRHSGKGPAPVHAHSQDLAPVFGDYFFW